MKFFLLLLFGLLSTTQVFATVAPIPTNKKTIQSILKSTKNLDPKVLNLAITAFNCAVKSNIPESPYLTVVDYDILSSQKRLWVIDLKTNKVIFNTFVAHGKFTGSFVAVHFGDKPNSLESSVGLFKTGKVYIGADGPSMYLFGLEKGFNDDAYARDIVMHGAWYVSEDFIEHYHRAGTSWGCIAIPKPEIKPIIATIKDGSLIFSYADQINWLKKSKFLHCNKKSK